MRLPMTSDFSASPGHSTAGWLSEVVGCPVTDSRCLALGEGGPSNVIIRFPPRAAENRAVAPAYDTYRRDLGGGRAEGLRAGWPTVIQSPSNSVRGRHPDQLLGRSPAWVTAMDGVDLLMKR
jgi:hypothetical protein